MDAQTQRLLTIEEYSKLPEEDEYIDELVRGQVVREPIPGGEHGWLQVRLAALLMEYAHEHRLGVVVGEAGFVLERDPPTVRGPDVAFISRERLGGSVPRGFFEGAPDLLVEVVSPSQTAPRVRARVLDFLEAGARLAWVVHPKARSITEYRSLDDVRTLGTDDVLDGGDVLPGFRVAVAEVFRSPFEGKDD